MSSTRIHTIGNPLVWYSMWWWCVSLLPGLPPKGRALEGLEGPLLLFYVKSPALCSSVHHAMLLALQHPPARLQLPGHARALVRRLAAPERALDWGPGGRLVAQVCPWCC